MASFKKCTVRFNGCSASALIDLESSETVDSLKRTVDEVLAAMMEAGNEDSISVSVGAVTASKPFDLLSEAKYRAERREEKIETFRRTEAIR